MFYLLIFNLSHVDDVKKQSVTEKLESCPLLNSHARGNLTTPSDEQSKIIKDSFGSFENSDKVQALAQDKGTRPTGNSQPNIYGSTEKNVKLEDEKGITLSRYSEFFCFKFYLS